MADCTYFNVAGRARMLDAGAKDNTVSEDGRLILFYAHHLNNMGATRHV
jgi:hypothetical protein